MPRRESIWTQNDGGTIAHFTLSGVKPLGAWQWQFKAVLVSSTVDPTVSQESVYVAISRAKYDLKIYAEDIEFLLEQAQESKAQETVLELLQPQAKGMVAAESVTTVKQKVEVSPDVGETLQSRYEQTLTSNTEQLVKQSREQGKAKLQVRLILKKEASKQLEVFWTPNSDSQAPPHIEAKHWRELYWMIRKLWF